MRPQREDVAAALAESHEEVGRDLAELISIPSVSGTPGEAQVQHWIAERLGSLGLRVRTWRTAVAELSARPGWPGAEVAREHIHGVHAELPAPRPSGGGLLLLGHSDVVPAPGWPNAFRPTVRNGSVVGRGAVDMKAGLAAAIHVARAFQAAGVTPAAGLQIAAVSAEEDGGAGAFDLISRGVRAAGCIIAEPTSGNIVVANGGALGFQLTLTGKAGHAASRWEGISALDVLETVRTGIESLESRLGGDPDPLMAQWPIPYPTSIGTVSGGDWSSTVMSNLTATGRFGVPLQLPAPQARAEFEELVAAAAAAVGGTARVQWIGGQYEPARQDPRHPFVAAVAAAHEAVVRQAPPVIGAPYGSDLRLMLRAGIPTVLYGPGDPALAHTDEESVAVEEIVARARTMASVALAAAPTQHPSQTWGNVAWL